jgi:hypothetical protein
MGRDMALVLTVVSAYRGAVNVSQFPSFVRASGTRCVQSGMRPLQQFSNNPIHAFAVLPY